MNQIIMAALITVGTGGSIQSASDAYNLPDATITASFVQAYYRRTQDFKARFIQIYSKRFHKAEAPRYGYLWVKKPGFMRWDYSSPRKKQLICDGRKIWIYVPGDKQVFWRSLKDSAVPSAISFLWGKGDLLREFDVKKLATSKYKSAGKSVLKLRPKRPSGSYKHVLLIVDDITGMVHESVVYEHLGNKNHYQFKGAKSNTRIGSQTFKFTPPRGVRVIAADRKMRL